MRLPCSKWYSCVSDEHYLPTVLAAAGLGNETTCFGNAMHVDWRRSPTPSSPYTYWQKVWSGRHPCMMLPAELDSNARQGLIRNETASRKACPWRCPHHLEALHACCVQDANLETFDEVRGQLGKCPFDDAIRCMFAASTGC